LKEISIQDGGQQNELKALKEASTVLNFNYEQCGMFVHKTLPDLGASPDALVGNEGKVEIKCPFSGKYLSAVEAVGKKFIKFCNVDNNNQLYLKKIILIITKYRDNLKSPTENIAYS
jgi:hypothetical protein